MTQHAPLTNYLLSTLVPLAVKAVLYFFILKWRQHKARVVTCIILGFAVILPSAIAPLPEAIAFAVGVGLALYILSQYTDVPLLPEGVIIIFSIEIGFAFVDRLILSPLLN